LQAGRKRDGALGDVFPLYVPAFRVFRAIRNATEGVPYSVVQFIAVNAAAV
jgi:hypothetical protein